MIGINEGQKDHIIQRQMNLNKLSILLLGMVFLVTPSCYLMNFEEEIEVEIVFDGSSSRSEINVSHLLDVNEYSSDFREYRDHIEEIEIREMTCWLNEFSGASGQSLTKGVLTISDAEGKGAEVLALLPETDLEQLYLHEQQLVMQEAGRQRTEELILTPPNTCLGIFTGEVDELPSSFIITFRIRAVIRGSAF